MLVKDMQVLSELDTNIQSALMQLNQLIERRLVIATGLPADAPRSRMTGMSAEDIILDSIDLHLDNNHGLHISPAS